MTRFRPYPGLFAALLIAPGVALAHAGPAAHTGASGPWHALAHALPYAPTLGAALAAATLACCALWRVRRQGQEHGAQRGPMARVQQE